MIEGSGSASLTNGSGSGRPKNIWILWILQIRIRNTGVNWPAEEGSARGADLTAVVAVLPSPLTAHLAQQALTRLPKIIYFFYNNPWVSRVSSEETRICRGPRLLYPHVTAVPVSNRLVHNNLPDFSSEEQTRRTNYICIHNWRIDRTFSTATIL